MWTVFPIPLGEAASFEPSIAEQTARATALETTASGIHWTFAGASDHRCLSVLSFALQGATTSRATSFALFFFFNNAKLRLINLP